MRWPRVRLRTMLLIVAITAVVFMVSGIAPRARRYRAMAEMEDQLAKKELVAALPYRIQIARNPARADDGPVFIIGTGSYKITPRMQLAGYEHQAAEHLRRRDGYLRAATFPWISPPRDPSAPSVGSQLVPAGGKWKIPPPPAPQGVSTPVMNARQARGGR